MDLGDGDVEGAGEEEAVDDGVDEMDSAISLTVRHYSGGS